MYKHKEIEKNIQQFWEEKKIYEKLKSKTKEGKPFYFCDGPPYATGQIHPGTAWNKSVKDAVCRYFRAIGRDVMSRPGFDTHGLPIEVKVEHELGFKNKNEIEKIGIENFVKKCKAFAQKYVKIMTSQFKSFGIWMDWESPYLTYKDEYIERSWETLKKAHEKGLLKRGKYVLPYCYRCETTLANYELEYGDEHDPSIYVKFKVKGKENEYLIIWTTTPWTLVANMGVMVNPKLEYVKLDVEGEKWIISKGRMDYLLEQIGKNAVILETFQGKQLEGLEYEHPFQDLVKKEYNRKVVLSDEYVNNEDGSGLVHLAPGHGPEDFIIGKRNNIPIFCPVDERGKYTEEAGAFKGKNVREANIEIIDLLKSRGNLILEKRITHRYPHCWRCKTPLIFISTDQWFVNISELKDKMLSEIEHTKWNPEFAKERFKGFVENAPDWCISRQRYWGIPLPIWVCKECGKIKVIGSKKELGKDVELHRPYVDEIKLKCECGGTMERVPDVLDVWFDSGNAVWASMSDEELKKYGDQADFIMEGQDQIRGWFYSLLGSGLLKYDKSSYKAVLMHGFFVDEKGEKMSKSVGNFIPVEDILDKYGADAFRLWGISNVFWDDIKFNWNEIKEAYADLNILWNLGLFVERFVDKKPEKGELLVEDNWIISRLNSVKKEFQESFETYNMFKGVRALRKFLNNDFSKLYMKLAKNRIKENEESAKYVLYYVFLETLKMFSIVSPHITEYIYRKFLMKYEGEESIHLLPMQHYKEEEINASIENKMDVVKKIVSSVLQARQEAKIKLRWPIDVVYVSLSTDSSSFINEWKDVLKALTNSKEIKEGELKDGIEVEFDGGKIWIPKEISEETWEEAMCSEIRRRVQQLRKEAKLIERDKIRLYVDTSGELKEIIEKNKELLEKETNTVEIVYTIMEDEGKEYVIDNRDIKLKIEKL